MSPVMTTETLRQAAPLWRRIGALEAALEWLEAEADEYMRDGTTDRGLRTALTHARATRREENG